MNQNTADETAVLDEPAPPFFVVSSTKFVVMSVFTFGLYDVFWLFMQWKAVREYENSRIWPAVRGIWFPFLFCYALFARMRDCGAQFGYKPMVPIWIVTVAFIFASIFALLLGNLEDVGDIPPAVFWLNFVMTPLILLPMQVLADKINMRVAPTYPYNRNFSKANIAGIVIGAIALLFIGLAYQHARGLGV